MTARRSGGSASRYSAIDFDLFWNITTGLREGALECERPRKQRRVNRLRVLRGVLIRLLELLLQLRQQHVEAGRRWTSGREGLEHGQRRRQRDLPVDQLLHERLEWLA